MDSEITERELIELERSVVPDNTSKATQYGMKKFNEWLALRDHACDFGTVTHEELCSLLRRFYAEVKAKKAGETLTPSTLTCIRAAIHRCLTSAPHSRPINIITDREFIAANNIFDARCKLYGSPVKVLLVLLFRTYLVLYNVQMHKYQPELCVCTFTTRL